MTANIQQVDAIFDLVPIKGDSIKVQCIVEAKNREGEFTNTEFLEVIRKGVFYSKQPHNIGIQFPLHLTISSTLKEFKTSNKSVVKLKQLAVEHEINFLTLKVAGQDYSTIKIELVPLLKNLPLFLDPKMTSIVIDNETLIEAIDSVGEKNGKEATKETNNE